jgi:hypothetical protein
MIRPRMSIAGKAWRSHFLSTRNYGVLSAWLKAGTLIEMTQYKTAFQGQPLGKGLEHVVVEKRN